MLPEWDKDVVVDCYGSHRRIMPTGRSDRYTRIEIALFSGRSFDAKRTLYRTIVDNLASVGVDPDDIKIILHEVPRENWGLRGGVPGSDIDLGFKIDV